MSVDAPGLPEIHPAKSARHGLAMPLLILLVPVLLLWTLLRVVWSIVRLQPRYDLYSQGSKERVYWRRRISRTVLLSWYVSNVTFGILQSTHGDLRLLGERARDPETVLPLLYVPNAPSEALNLPGWSDGVAMGVLVLMMVWAFQPLRRRSIMRVVDRIIDPIFGHAARFGDDFATLRARLEQAEPGRTRRKRSRAVP